MILGLSMELELNSGVKLLYESIYDILLILYRT